MLLETMCKWNTSMILHLRHPTAVPKRQYIHAHSELCNMKEQGKKLSFWWEEDEKLKKRPFKWRTPLLRHNMPSKTRAMFTCRLYMCRMLLCVCVCVWHFFHLYITFISIICHQLLFCSYCTWGMSGKEILGEFTEGGSEEDLWHLANSTTQRGSVWTS